MIAKLTQSKPLRTTVLSFGAFFLNVVLLLALLPAAEKPLNAWRDFVRTETWIEKWPPKTTPIGGAGKGIWFR